MLKKTKEITVGFLKNFRTFLYRKTEFNFIKQHWKERCLVSTKYVVITIHKSRKMVLIPFLE